MDHIAHSVEVFLSGPLELDYDEESGTHLADAASCRLILPDASDAIPLLTYWAHGSLADLHGMEAVRITGADGRCVAFTPGQICAELPEPVGRTGTEVAIELGQSRVLINPRDGRLTVHLSRKEIPTGEARITR